MLWTLAASLFLQQAATSPQATIAEAAFVDSLEAAELRFFHEWGQLWHASELSRHQVVGQFQGPQGGNMYRRDGGDAILPVSGQIYQRAREDNATCFSNEKALWASRHLIPSRSSVHGACPSWLFSPLETVDERDDIDGGLRSEYRAAARAARRSVAEVFVAASARFPRNDWIIGQAVRLLVDARNFDVAQSTAEACAATRWWCGVLRGYVLGARAQTISAENAFRTAIEHMPADLRCRWTDAAVLLDSLARSAYAAVPCQQRDSLDRNLWWLTDPLYSVPGNPRLVEHYTRQTLVALHSALDRDERFDWRPELGGDALAQMILRYGWPSYTYWGGELAERGHNDWLADNPTGFKKTYTTFEYDAGRVHLFPSFSALQSPLRATAADWMLRDPAPPADPNTSAWWPQEHFAAPVAQLSGLQLAALRRHDKVLVAAAVDIDSAFARSVGSSLLNRAMFVGTLLMTDHADSVDVIARGRAGLASTLVLRGTATSRAALLGVEIAGDSARSVIPARTRFGVSPPATLATMLPGEVAISEPVVLRAPAGDAPPPLDADSALALMLGSTRIATGTKVAVYWETYGFQPSDSVTVALWIERYTQQGFMRQLGIAFKVATDLNTPVANTWDEVSSNIGSRLIPGPVPIIGRNVVLDISKLPKGDYWLEVAVGKRGQTPVRARRSVTIQ